MHRDFGDWYRLVSLAPEDHQLKLRWSAIEKWSSEESDQTSVLELVRVFLQIPTTGPGVREKFATTFQGFDSAFSRRNELELRVLAGATLAHLASKAAVESGPERGGIVAGQAVVAATQFRPLDARLAEVALASAQAVEQIELRWRTRRSAVSQKGPLAPTPKQLSALQGADAAQLATQVAALAAQWNSAIGVLESSLSSLRANLEFADEEVNVLWWVVGEFSRLAQEPWAKLDPGAIAVLAPKELCDLTVPRVGLPQARSLLSRVLGARTGTSQSFEATINAMPLKLVDACVSHLNNSVALDLTPICAALLQRVKAGDQGWQEYFSRSTGIDVRAQYPAELIALYAYRENVLHRTLFMGDK